MQLFVGLGNPDSRIWDPGCGGLFENVTNAEEMLIEQLHLNAVFLRAKTLDLSSERSLQIQMSGAGEGLLLPERLGDRVEPLLDLHGLGNTSHFPSRCCASHDRSESAGFDGCRFVDAFEL